MISEVRIVLPASPKTIVTRLIRGGIEAQPEPVRHAVRSLWQEIKIAGRARRALRQFSELRGQRNLNVHLGCGPELKPGWINIDLNLNGSVPAITSAMASETIFVNYDLRLGILPLDDGSCSRIYSAHFFEHLEYLQGLALMRDCYRVLRQGGTFRACLPNFRRLFGAYLERDDRYLNLINILDVLPDIEPGSETLIDYVNYGVYQSGEHKCIYDEEKLCLILRRMGFSSAYTSEYMEGIDPANESRRRYSFYVEAVK